MSDAIYRTVFRSPLGELRLASDGDHLTEILLPPHKRDVERGAIGVGTPAVLGEAMRQLAAYFAGELTAFDLPLELHGTDFQRRVWLELSNIEFDTTVSYSEVARRIGRPTACRAVGAANGRNPIPIIGPCHRVIGANRSLVGYGGGLPAKQWLLEHETRVASLIVV
jgi:methylated-DNA-[protein]-cysteine S-methyltransferase